MILSQILVKFRGDCSGRDPLPGVQWAEPLVRRRFSRKGEHSELFGEKCRRSEGALERFPCCFGRGPKCAENATKYPNRIDEMRAVFGRSPKCPHFVDALGYFRPVFAFTRKWPKNIRGATTKLSNSVGFRHVESSHERKVTCNMTSLGASREMSVS